MARPAAVIHLSEEEEKTLRRWLRAGTTEHRYGERARIVLLASEGQSTEQMAEGLRTRPARGCPSGDSVSPAIAWLAWMTRRARASHEAMTRALRNGSWNCWTRTLRKATHSGTAGFCRRLSATSATTKSGACCASTISA